MASNTKPNFSAAYSKANEILVKSRVISTFPFSPIDLVKEQSAIKCRTYKKPGKQKSMGQAWFPKSWTEKDIRRAGEHVAGLKGNRRVADGKKIYGVYKGVRVGVIRTNGKIATVFPDSDQSLVLNKRRK